MNQTVRIGVISDSHRLVSRAQLAVERMGDLVLVLHAGDHYSDAKWLEDIIDIPVTAVVGNCDLGSPGPLEEVVEVAGKKIMLTHGHFYNVKKGYRELAARGRQVSADLVVFGHTHVPEIINVDGLTLFNPGTLTQPRTGGTTTYGLITIQNEQIKPEIFELGFPPGSRI